jgi:hypothetical protein
MAVSQHDRKAVLGGIIEGKLQGSRMLSLAVWVETRRIGRPIMWRIRFAPLKPPFCSTTAGGLLRMDPLTATPSS